MIQIIEIPKLSYLTGNHLVKCYFWLSRGEKQLFDLLQVHPRLIIGM